MDTIFICSFAGLRIIGKMLVVTGQVAGGKLINHVPINFAPQHSGNVAPMRINDEREFIQSLRINRREGEEWVWRYRLLTYSQTMFSKRGINPFKASCLTAQEEQSLSYTSNCTIFHEIPFFLFLNNNTRKLSSIRSEYSYNFHISNVYHFFAR